jgi:hypothetical protein
MVSKVSKLPSLGVGVLGAVGTGVLAAGVSAGFSLLGAVLDVIGGALIGSSIFAVDYKGKNKYADEFQALVDKVDALKVPAGVSQAVADAVVQDVSKVVK